MPSREVMERWIYEAATEYGHYASAVRMQDMLAVLDEAARIIRAYALHETVRCEDATGVLGTDWLREWRGEVDDA